MALIIKQTGAAYRPLGAMMAIYQNESHIGHLSSGCIEADILQHAKSIKQPTVFRYGAGSSYMDLKLPCGGTLDVLIIPNPELGLLHVAMETLSKRNSTAFCVDIISGKIALSNEKRTVLKDTSFHLYLEPELKFFVFGNGYEASQFAELVNGAGYPVTLHSTNQTMLNATRLCEKRRVLLKSPYIPNPSEIDLWTSVSLFFHEHDHEDRILLDAVKTPAFYIGAQGSLTAHIIRISRLKSAGASLEEVTRCKGPIGLIPQVRDPKTLAISVLAEILCVSLERAK